MVTRIVDVNLATAAMAEIELRLRNHPKEIDKVIKRASKRAATHGQKEIAKAIRSKSNIKSAITKEKMKKGTSGSKGAFVKLNKTGRLGVRNFKAKQTADGVKYQIGKKDKWLTVPKSFQGPTVHIGTKITEGKGKKAQRLAQPKKLYQTTINPKWQGNAAVRVGMTRLPIVFVRGVSPAGFFYKRKLLKPSKKSISDFFYKRLRQEIRFVLLKKSKKR